MSTLDESSEIDLVEDEDVDVSLPSGVSITTQRPINGEATAANLGKIIVWTFTGSVAICFLVVLVEIMFQFLHPSEHELTLTASFELFKTVSAFMSGPLGFVLGFYFRDGNKS
jgi:hypothetical protein